MASHPSNIETITLAFTEAQLETLRKNGFKPEQTHRQHRPDEVEVVFVYEAEEYEMILWGIQTDGTLTRESRQFGFSSGWDSDAEESEDDE